MQKLVFTNGGGQTIDLTSGNFGITNWEGLSGVGLNIQVQQVPFQDGGVFLDALMEQREISVTVAIQDNNDLSARYERKRQLISALNPKLGEGVLVYTNDYLSRQIKAVPQLPIFENKNSNDAGTLKANVTFSCCSPYWEDLQETVVAFGFNDQPTITNNGDIPAQLNIEWETNKVTNGTLENVTQGQKIKYNGTLENNLKINTNIGQKSVTSESMRFDLLDTGSTCEVCTYAKDIETTLVIATDGTGFVTTDGQTWISTTVATNVSMYSAVYANNLHRFVACGRSIGVGSTKIRWSDDGINWNDCDGEITAQYYQTVTYSEDKQLFVTVGAGGVIATSSDGKTWTNRTSGVSTGIFGVCYSEMDSLFVAVGASNVVLTSANGTTWTSRDSGVTGTLRRVCHSARLGLFVAVLNDNTGIVSSDGINWSSVNITISNMAGLCYSEVAGKFLVVGQGSVATSPDGMTWTVIGGFSDRFYSASYSSNVKKFYTTGGTGALLSSTDGLTWEVEKSGLDGSYSCITYAEGLDCFFMSGSKSSSTLHILKSSDFSRWELVYTESTSSIPTFITYFENINKIVLCADYCYSSTDGITWTKHTFRGVKIIYAEELEKYFLIRGNKIYSSTDFENWDSGFTLEHISSLKDICYSKSKNMLVAIGTSTNYTAYSVDGINWIETRSGLSTIGNYPALAFSEEIGIFVIADTFLYTSYDGINWAKRTSQGNRCIVYAKEKNQFLIGGLNVSSDGINWSSISGGKQLYYVIYSKRNNCYYGVKESTTLKSYTEIIGNCIDKISTDSNIGMNLAIGNNTFRATAESGDMSVVLRYRQKYIGV